MDLVYLEARTSIALLHSHLQQKHLDALLLIYEANHAQLWKKRRGRSKFEGCRALDLTNLTEAVSIIANDKWNTRAWVLQVNSSSQESQNAITNTDDLHCRKPLFPAGT
jgi:hypothetical protein